MKKTISVVLTLMLLLMVSVPVMAEDNDMPSIGAKSAPAVSVMTDPEGNAVPALMYDSNGNVVAGVPEKSMLNSEGIVITPLASANSAPNANASEGLKNTYELIKNIDSLSDLGGGIEKAMKAQNSNTDPADWKVTDMFDISATQDINELLDGGNVLTMKLNVGAAKGYPVVAMVGQMGSQGTIPLGAEGNWAAMKTVNNGDGTITVNFTKVGQVIIVQDTSYMPNVGNATVQSPQTGSDDGIGAYVALCGLLLAAAVYAAGKRIGA